MKEKKKKLRSEHIILAVIILLQLVTLVYLFTAKKNIYDCDEYYSYGLSNSYKRPFISPFSYERGVEGQLTFNYTGDDFKYYLRTSPDTRFRYDSVYYNQAHDTIPPLYYAIIHTICSVRTGHFSWYYAFVINLLCFIPTQIFIYLIGLKVTRSKFLSLLTVAFWGFTLGGISCFIFLRMYAMLTMFGAMFTYYSINAQTEKKLSKKTCIMLALSAFLGALTHHNFLIFAFFLTLFSCLFILIQKSFKKMFIYGLSVLIGTALSFAAFPATVKHLTMKMPWADKLDLFTSLRFYTVSLKDNLTGSKTLYTGWLLYVRVALVFIVAFSIPIIFLFRKSAFIQKAFKATKTGLKAIKRKLSDPNEMNPGGIILLLTIISFMAVIAHMTYFLELLEKSIRYLYIILPYTVMLITGLIGLFFRKAKKPVKIGTSAVCSLLLAGLLIYQNSVNSPAYLTMEPSNKTPVSDFTKDTDCILMIDDMRAVINTSLMLSDANDILLTRTNHKVIEKDVVKDEMQKVFDKNKPFILLIDNISFYSEADKEEYYRNKEAIDAAIKEKIDDDSFTLEGSADLESYAVKYRQYNDLRTESGVVEYFEKLSGYSSEYCTEETSTNCCIAAYRFTPPEK
ncbi:MAG: hypothetical protein IKH96_13240 [Ruminococcus sp.]|uniref:hypothetical protein n=1 Tax=Ruminococcus sp. TaxID=41978 RepID=UPI0025CBC7A0|nr:hypothetical protein [Ruminococcus sp.]MBR6996960.1 hypothetical protein [Ruminococcus sp.]